MSRRNFSSEKGILILLTLFITWLIGVAWFLGRLCSDVCKYDMLSDFVKGLLVFLAINTLSGFLLIQEQYVNYFLIFLVVTSILFFGFWKLKVNEKSKAEHAILLRQKSYWLGLDGWQYEEEVANVFRMNGYRADVTKKSGDGGVDIILFQGGIKTYVQCKFYQSNTVPVAAVREFYGVMISNGVSRGILVGGDSGFSNDTMDFARKNNIQLMGLDDVIKMSIQAPQTKPTEAPDKSIIPEVIKTNEVYNPTKQGGRRVDF